MRCHNLKIFPRATLGTLGDPRFGSPNQGDRRSNEKVAALFEKRVEAIMRLLVQASVNLNIAQHRDLLRYKV